MTKVREMHGLSRSEGKRASLYQVWIDIRKRCQHSQNKWYRRYGGRGIKLCERWQKFSAFAADVGPHPGDRMTLDRRDNDGNYEPGNVRWVTRTQQARNSSWNVMTEADAAIMRRLHAQEPTTAVAMARVFGVSEGTVHYVLKRGGWK